MPGWLVKCLAGKLFSSVGRVGMSGWQWVVGWSTGLIRMIHLVGWLVGSTDVNWLVGWKSGWMVCWTAGMVGCTPGTMPKANKANAQQTPGGGCPRTCPAVQKWICDLNQAQGYTKSFQKDTAKPQKPQQLHSPSSSLKQVSCPWDHSTMLKHQPTVNSIMICPELFLLQLHGWRRQVNQTLVAEILQP